MSITRIDPRHLRFFVAVAEELNFRKAAERLHLTQPALTRQIQAMESTMGVRLFERDKRHVALTSAGHAAFPRCRALLKDMDDMVVAAQRAAKGEIGSLRLGFISFVAYEYLPPILRAFRAKFPDVSIELHEFLVMQQFEMLLDGRIDVAMLRPLYKDSRIATKVVVKSRFVAALRADHPLLRKSSVRMKDLANEDFISLPKRFGPSFHAQIMGFCSDAGFMPSVVHEGYDAQGVIGLVGAGMGVAVVPESVAKLNTAGVEYRLVHGLSVKAEIVLAWRSENTSEVLRHFIQIAAKTMRNL